MHRIILRSIACLLFAASMAPAADVTIAWDYPYPTDYVVGFSAHWGPSSRVYTARQDIADQQARQITVRDLAPTETVYFAMTAYNLHTNHSEYSVELVWDNTPPGITWLTETLAYDVPAGAPLVMPDYRGLVMVLDNVSSADEVVLSQTPAPGAPLPIGDSLVTITAADEAGNISDTSRQLTVTVRVELAPVEVTGVDSEGRKLVINKEAVHE